MMRLLVSGAIALAAVVALAAQRPADDPALFDAPDGPVLARFDSDEAFRRYLRTISRTRHFDVAEDALGDLPASTSAPASPPAARFAAEAAPGNPEITNNQTIGVDEGGIVKQIGRHLVILQDGRLFSADLGDGPGAPLRLADRIDVYRSPASAASWYDEMLVIGNRILVTAYNYREQASEITVVRMDESGRLRRQGRFLLSSNDYYSTENYATRLVGDNLVFYAPLALDSGDPDGSFQWPRIRRADGDGDAGAGEALIGPTDVYAPPGRVEWPVLHTVSICPLRAEMDCRTTAFIGPAMREFYVSPTDAFLWIGAPDGLPWSIDYANLRRACPQGQYRAGGAGEAALLYRLPLDGGAIGAVGVDGVPADQFAFDSRDGRFRALLQRPGAGCIKNGAASPLALLDLPLGAFGRRIRHVAPAAYSGLPPIEGGALENRFVGNWLVYGGRTDWSSAAPGRNAGPLASALFAVPLDRPAAAVRLSLPHNAIRIERAGNDAVVTGYRDQGGLSLSYVSLGSRPRIAATALLPRRFESEGRSHAFNAWIRPDGSGLIGLPTTLRIWRSGRGWSNSESSELSFIAIATDKALAPAGELAVRGRRGGNGPNGYRCEVSCVDWYGNSRPIFTGGRVFALMGTDLVEGRMAGGRIGEVGRLDLTGPAARPSQR